MTTITILTTILAALIQTYTNPVLWSDYSDPDLICVDGEYWMTSSSFNCVPGLQILHSTNLVDWEIVNAGLPDALEPNWRFSRPSHGNGVWAPSIRHFNGKFWIFWGDPDNGVYQIHADHPAGLWSKPVQIWKGKGIIDTCPLLDDDGKIYLVHAWAGSRAGFKSVLCVCELDGECTHITSGQVLVFDGKKTGDDTIEGPKFYKRDGWYYIFAPAGGVKEGWQMVLRSRNVYGPYEYRKVLHQGNTSIHGPHQGGWVEDAAGDSWFLHFEDRDEWGRVAHLQPMEWTSDGWCTMGEDIDGDGIGEPVARHKAPASYEPRHYSGSVDALATGTDFTHPRLPYNWQWHANPRADWALYCPAEGYVRLNCIQDPRNWDNLWNTPNLLLEKVVGPEMDLCARLVFRPSYEGDRAGLVVMGEDYSTVEFAYDGEKTYLRRVLCINADEGTPEIASDSLALENSVFYNIYAKLKISTDGVCRFFFSPDGKKYKEFGEAFKMKPGRWIGAKVGFFATAKIKKNDSGSVDVY